MTTVYLHVGLAKTGTSAIQRSLFGAKDELAEQGILYPGESVHSQREAVYDVVGRRIAGDDASSVSGAWARLLREVEQWHGDSVVISEELLSLVRPKQVRRIVDDLGGDVQLLMTLREIGSVLPSAWQQEIRKGRSVTWPEFLTSVRDTSQGAATAGVAFWLRQDPLRVLDLWEGRIPREQVQIITVPGRGQPRTLLLDRFAASIGAGEGTLQPVERSNPSLSPAGVEVVRRLNEALDARASQRHHLTLINAITPALSRHEGPSARVPHEELPTLTAYTDALTEELSDRGYRLRGTWEELAPVVAGPDEPALDAIDQADLLAATETALVSVSRAYSRVQRRAQRSGIEPGDEASARERVSSTIRAKAFGLRVGALERGDDNPALRWLARRQTGSPMGRAPKRES